jgi:hypothetical protein
MITDNESFEIVSNGPEITVGRLIKPIPEKVAHTWDAERNNDD